MLMAIDAHLPPACAFAISVLVERDMDPEAVPEEAVEAAQLHLVTCVRCLASPPAISPPRKKKKPRRVMESDTQFETYTPTPYEEAAPPSIPPGAYATVAADGAPKPAPTFGEPSRPVAIPQPKLHQGRLPFRSPNNQHPQFHRQRQQKL